MGDICDLPNFSKKSWFRRAWGVKLLMVLGLVFAAALSWGYSEPLDDVIDMALRVHYQGSSLQTGQMAAFSITIKNNGDKTVKFSDLQMEMNLVEGTCLETAQVGKKIFSLPQNVMVSPNATEVVTGEILVNTACAGKAATGIFSVVERESERRAISKPGPKVDIL